jgi:hypothetical protein
MSAAAPTNANKPSTNTAAHAVNATRRGHIGNGPEGTVMSFSFIFGWSFSFIRRDSIGALHGHPKRS